MVFPPKWLSKPPSATDLLEAIAIEEDARRLSVIRDHEERRKMMEAAKMNYPTAGQASFPGSQLQNPNIYGTNQSVEAQRSYSDIDKLEMRLNKTVNQLRKQGLDIVGIRRRDQTTFLFAMHNDKPLTLTDDAGDLFPSDALVGKFNVLLG